VPPQALAQQLPVAVPAAKEGNWEILKGEHMRTTVVPAQITTVEDKIAGSITLPQLILLVIPLITSTAVYASIGPRLHFTVIKTSLILLQFMVFDILAIRFRGKILGDWLVIYLRFAARPRLYIFTKNDTVGRDIAITKPEKDTKEVPTAVEEKFISAELSLSQRMKLDRIFAEEKLSVRFRIAGKGGLDVSLKPVEE